MKPAVLLLVSFLWVSLDCFAQNYNTNKPADTIKLPPLSCKKVLAYQINEVIILVDYEQFMASFKPFWKKYQKGVRSLDRGKIKAEEENPSYVKRFKHLDATYKRLIEEIKNQDTVYVSQKAFIKADIGISYNFAESIEKGNCAVLNKNKQLQPIILRQEYSYQSGPLDGWGGFLYFIPGQPTYFISLTKWVS